jgi:predicted RNA-binding protein with PIN domain
VLVFDGQGADERVGSLEVRWAEDADTLLERLAAENRGREQVAVVSSDTEIRGAAGIEVRKLASQTFLGELSRPSQPQAVRGDLRDRLDPETLDRLERLRRGER